MTIFSPPPVEGQVSDSRGKFSAWWIRWINQVQALLRNLRLYPESYYYVPIDGFTLTTPADVGNLVLNPSSALNSGTVYLPAYPIDNQVFQISSTKGITSLSILTSDGTSISNASASIAAGSGFVFRFLESTDTWYLVLSGGTGGGGSGVTFVGLQAPSSEINVEGSPITSAGQIILSWQDQTAHYVFAAPTGADGTPSFRQLLDEDVAVNHLTGATWDSQEDFNNVMLSPGIITGGTISDIGGGSIRVAAGTAILRIADDNVSSLVFVNFAQTDFALTANDILQYVGLLYNSGSPIIQLRTTENWDKDTEIAMGSAVRLSSGGVLTFNNPFLMGDPITNIIQRFDSFAAANRDAAVGGLALGVTGTRNVTLSAGRAWARLNDYPVTAKNTSTGDTMISAYFNGTAWVFVPGVTQWPNDQYNDITSGLVTMSNNKYSNLWFYASFDSNAFGFEYGQNQYNTLADAVAESPPSFRSANAAAVTLLLGRFVFQKGDTVPQQINQAFDTVFVPTSVSNHNSLSGLQGGTTNEYYHLTAAQYATISGGGGDGVGGKIYMYFKFI